MPDSTTYIPKKHDSKESESAASTSKLNRIRQIQHSLPAHFVSPYDAHDSTFSKQEVIKLMLQSLKQMGLETSVGHLLERETGVRLEEDAVRLLRETLLDVKLGLE